MDSELIDPIAPGEFRVSVTTYIPDCLRELGVDPDPVIKAQGLDPASFGDPDNVIAYADAVRVLNSAAHVSNCEHFGLLLGRMGGLHILGPVGAQIRKAKSIGAALTLLKNGFSTHDRGAVLDIVIDDESVELRYIICDPGVTCAARVSDTAMSVACMILLDLCGPGWKPSRILLARRKPADDSPYRETFGCPIDFNSFMTAIRFPSAWFGRDIHQPVAEPIARIRRDHSENFTARIPELCVTMLFAGNMPTMKAVASALAVSERTLRRRLITTGTSFSEVLARTRHTAAVRLLTDTDLTVKDIAQGLCYSELSAFTRAFRSWTGVAPNHFRKTNADR